MNHTRLGNLILVGALMNVVSQSFAQAEIPGDTIHSESSSTEDPGAEEEEEEPETTEDELVPSTSTGEQTSEAAASSDSISEPPDGAPIEAVSDSEQSEDAVAQRVPTEASAEEAGGEESSDASDEEEEEEEEDERAGSWSGGIAPFASQETSVGVGALLAYSFFLGDDPEVRRSSIQLSASATIRKQGLANLGPWIFFADSRFALQGSYAYLFFPNRFYGLGNQTADLSQSYTENRFRADTEFQWRFAEGWSWGFRHELDFLKVVRVGAAPVADNTYLDSLDLAGAEGVTTNGVGMSVFYDTRDSIFSATHGRFGRAELVVYPEVFGGAAATFARLKIDARTYFPTFSSSLWKWDEPRSQVLAFQLFGEFVIGDAPFQALPEVGGTDVLRGFYQGRYRDNNYMAAQAEYRIPLFWRFDAAAFFSVGTVFGPNSTGGDGRFLYSGGAGLRVLFKAESRMMLRADIAFAPGDIGILFGGSEAF